MVEKDTRSEALREFGSTQATSDDWSLLAGGEDFPEHFRRFELMNSRARAPQRDASREHPISQEGPRTYAQDWTASPADPDRTPYAHDRPYACNAASLGNGPLDPRFIVVRILRGRGKQIESKRPGPSIACRRASAREGPCRAPQPASGRQRTSPWAPAYPSDSWLLQPSTLSALIGF